MTTDPLLPLLELPGVAAAADRARDALSAVHRHPANLRGWDKTATEASWRAGRSSAAIDGGSVELRRDGDFDDPILAGAIRVAQALDGDSLDGLTTVFRRAPAQAFARLHMLAAAGLVDEVRALAEHGLRHGVTAARALGYAQVLADLDAGGDGTAAREPTFIGTRRYVRRQRSWFRRDHRITWLDGAAAGNVDEVLRVLDALQSDELCACNWKKGDPTIDAGELMTAGV